MARLSFATPEERHTALEERLTDLKRIRQPYFEKWKEISQFISPFSGRFDIHEHGEDRDLGYILDSEATRDLNTLASGLMSGASSPARPWFSLMPSNPDLAQSHQVAKWCTDVQKIILKVFAQSNTYNSLHQMYKELALFGIAADVLTDSYTNLIEHHVLSAGEYCVASDINGNINTLYREFEMTTAQIVAAFGYDNVSQTIKSAYDRGDLNDYFIIVQAIEPRTDRDPHDKTNKGMPFASYYYEQNTDARGLLRESGFDEFPCICPRWDILGSDPYGSSPCFVVLPDVKQLQQETLRKSELIDQYSRPPLQVPNSARQTQISLSAGALNYTPATGTDQTIKPIVTTLGDLNALTQDIIRLKEAIKDGLFVRQFLMLEEAAGDRKTTVEVYALKEEKMLVLGSVIERNNNECLGRLVELTYHRLLKAGSLPPPPSELADTEMNVEFQSVLSQAQKAVDINSVDRMVSAVASISQLQPEVLDRLDPDGYVDVYQQRLGVDPTFLRSKEDADAIRQQRAQAQQQQAQMEQQQQQAQSLNQLAQAAQHGSEASMSTQSLDAIAGGGVL